MVNPVVRYMHPGQAAYSEQVERTKWRQDMLKEMLAKVRGAGSVAETSQPMLPGSSKKGSLLDVFI